MRDYRKDYFEQSCLWEADYISDPGEKERIYDSIEAIPSDTRSVLDVGCGNGAFVNTLYEKFPDRFDKIVGLDNSTEALKHVKTEKVNESIDSIPFESKSVDLVSCFEVLEHLPHEIFKKGISEIQRVSRKYILISVPNDEILEYFLVLCPQCRCAFNPYFHMRSFSKEILGGLFDNFKTTTIREIGPLKRFYSDKKISPFLRLFFMKPSPSKASICPQCGYQNKVKDSYEKQVQAFSTLCLHRLSRLLKPIIKTKKKKRWLLSLYVRTDNKT